MDKPSALRSIAVRMLSLALFVAWSTLTAVRATAQEPDKSTLTLDRIFTTGEFDEQKLNLLRWSQRAPAYFTLEKSIEQPTAFDIVRVSLNEGTMETVASAREFLPDGRSTPLGIDDFQFSHNESKLLIYTNSRRVWRQSTRGDYWVLDLASRKLQRVGGDAPEATLMFAKFSPDGSRVAYVHKNNIYAQDLSDLSIDALTTDGSDDLINGTSDWVNEEELEIRDAFRWSPDGESIAYWQFDTRQVPRFNLLNNIDGKYPTIQSFPYPKVGETNSAVRIGVVSSKGGVTGWLDLPGDPRNHYLARMEWVPDGERLIVQQFNRLQNTNRVFLADAKTCATQLVLSETEAAWLENDNPVRWVKEGQNFVWLSERTGWRHAYLASALDGKQTAITAGDFDVISVETIDHANGWVYFSASPDDPKRRYLYRSKLTGGAAERITPADRPGWHAYDISPNAQWAVHTHSTFTSPPRCELIQLPSHEVARTLVDNRKLRDRLDSLRMPGVEFLRVDTEEAQLDTWCIRPPAFDSTAKYPLLFHVYGEPHGQLVKDQWPGKRGVWHWMLAQQGYLIAGVDNRGTIIPRGREWRKCIHRQIGILASKDQASAARTLLRRWPFADPRRVGIWGWSGGGSMSLNAIFRYPELYQTAIAVAPNADQRLYDTIYQERYMGLPEQNEEGYRLGSPIAFADQLKGNLLLVHGTGDDNCHYQGTEKLIDELIAHGKRFTVMPYPSRSHAISEGRNTTRHFYGLLTQYLQVNLPTGLVAHDSRDDLDVSERTGHIVRHMAGWTVRIRRELFEESRALTDKALELLQQQLDEIVRVVPAKAVLELKKVPLWISPEYAGHKPKAEYHPGAGWLVENGRDPEMAKGIEFTNVRIFEAETRRMPNFALHELAHAYHDRFLPHGFLNEQIVAAHQRATAKGVYDQVEQRFGDGRVAKARAYALTNPQEYFAECTEAYFTRNDFFPFTREELRTHDPAMSQLLEQLWNP